MLMLLTFAGSAAGRLLRRAALALTEPPAAAERELPPEWFKFPLY